MKTSESWHPVPWEDADANAVAAVMEGKANEDQQRRAMDWIIYKCCGTYDMPYRPGPDDRDTNFALGRMFVGQQIIALPKKLLIVKSRRKAT